MSEIDNRQRLKVRLAFAETNLREAQARKNKVEAEIVSQREILSGLTQTYEAQRGPAIRRMQELEGAERSEANIGVEVAMEVVDAAKRALEIEQATMEARSKGVAV